ncbi:hypothetical protein CVT26_002042 [Gymnopilus dilepis]|uniref:DNA replication regulator SLD2 n=1 Tax=Gymnopilus dilepis TaxID=231916 RepID=A0A409VBV5_9AGAR|nr:hypothetical protein CVT26_002042 [Gymnopilus dilepis]
MSELATVRAEIKAWERSFKSTNGRAATVDDIKQNPPIADKYKLYKKLSKAAASASSSSTPKASEPPSTPQRSTRPKPAPSLLLSQSRAVQPAPPLASFNPFSPQKKQNAKGKEKAASHSNPFASPTRPQKRSTSPEPFPAIRKASTSSASSSQSSLNKPPEPPSAVSRARKRLRGEPVSPSPNKDKRRRVSSQTTLAFPRLNLDAPGSDKEEEQDEEDLPFVDESPVKVPANGRTYPKLFGESSLAVDLFGTKDSQGTRLEDSKAPTKRALKIVKTSSRLTSFLQPAKRDSTGSTQASLKRAHSDGEDGEAVQKPAVEKLPLIPPSPPPSTSSLPFHLQNKAQAKAASNRKKARVDDKMKESDSDDLETLKSQTKLRIVDRKATRRQLAAAAPEEDDVTSDSDPILAYARFATPHAPAQTHDDSEEGTVEIDLPDELRRVLALQPADSKKQHTEEDRLVKSLILGRRTTHYDPQKGGEIWDVGEDYHEDGSEGNAYTEGEEDWEGEPVPWEIGEL